MYGHDPALPLSRGHYGGKAAEEGALLVGCGPAVHD
jgi:hypothetical protein